MGKAYPGLPYHPDMMCLLLAVAVIDPLAPTWRAWVGPGLIVLLMLALAGWILMRRCRRQVWDQLAAEIGLTDVTPQTIEELIELRRQLSRHVLTLIAGIDNVARRLVGQIDNTHVEVLDFEAFGVGHWVPVSVRDALAQPERVADKIDFTRDRPGYGELWQTAVLIRSDSLQLPRFILMPENYLTRRVPEPRGIDLSDAYPLFTQRHRLLAADQRAADRLNELFTRTVQLALEKNRDLTIEGDGDTLLLYRIGHAMTPQRVRRLIVDAMELCEMLASPTARGLVEPSDHGRSDETASG